MRDVTELGVIRHCGHRTMAGFDDIDIHLRAIGQQGSAPAPRPEGRDRHQSEQWCVQRQDRAADGQVIGRGAGRRGDQQTIGDQFAQALLAVDGDGELCRLVGLAQHRDLVDGACRMGLAMDVTHIHQQRMHHGDFRRCQPIGEFVLAEIVHQETDGAAIHAVDRLGRAHETVQRLQHQAVTAECDDHIRFVGRDMGVTRRQPFQARRVPHGPNSPQRRSCRSGSYLPLTSPKNRPVRYAA